MILRDEKRRLIQEVIANSVEEKNFVSFAIGKGVAAPPHMIQRWKERFYSAQRTSFPSEPKLINRFMVGADPEFALLRPDIVNERGVRAEAYHHARNLGMNAAEPFGSDLSGRQAEVRAHPSRFVVEVVSSLCDTLRWMSAAYPTNDYYWYAGAMIGTDGIGGHIHIGRRRPGQDAAIKCLDKLTAIMIHEKLCLDSKGAERRSASTVYGKFGDYRIQPHGYEYRTMPTWMDTPLTAHLTMTWAKLAVLHDIRDVVIDLKSNQGYAVLRNLLRAYADRDDDARIALKALDLFGIPRHGGQDFKQHWGISTKKNTVNPDRHFFPNTIRPDDRTVREMFDYLTTGHPLSKSCPAPTWDPFVLPEHVSKLDITQRGAGLAETSAGFVSHHIHTLLYNGQKNGQMVVTVPKTMTMPVDAIKRMVQKLDSIKIIHFRSDSDMPHLLIELPKNIAVQYHADNKVVADCRALIGKSGLFPITPGERMENYDPQRFVAVKKKESHVGKMCEVVKGQAVNQG